MDAVKNRIDIVENESVMQRINLENFSHRAEEIIK